MANVKRKFGLMRELLQTQIYMMEEHALAAYRHQLLNNFNQHVLAEDLEIPQTESHHMVCYKKGTREVTAVQFFDENLQLVEETSNGDMVMAHEPHEDEERVLMLEMTGPVTRSGGMCSYGSQDFRDMLKEYADDPSVVGMVLITDTPGGTAFALHDMKQGMAAWNAAGKRSIQWIDGMSCSAGVALGSQCQKILAYNEKDVVGCIGAMMAGWTTADGTIDENGNRFIDLVASQTPDKNGEFRAAAAGDYKGLQKMLDECGQDFLNLLSEVRPQIPADMKTGKTYDAGDCIGTLIDGIGSLEDAVNYALTGEMAWTTPSNSPEGENTLLGEGQGGVNPADDPDHNPNEDPDFDPEDDPMNKDNNNQPDASAEGTISIDDMTLRERIMAVLGLTEGAEDQQQAQAPATEQTVETPAEEQVPATPTGEAPQAEAPLNEPAEGAQPEGEQTVETPETSETAEGDGTGEAAETAEGTEAPEGKCKPKSEDDPEGEGDGEGDEEDPENPEGKCDPEKKCAEQEALIQEQVNQIAAYDKQVTDLQAELDSLKASHKEEMEQNATAQSDLLAMTQQSAKFEALYEQEKKQAEEAKADYTKGIEAKDAELKAANERIAQLEGLLKEASAELKELQESAPAAPQAPAAPHDNQEQAEDNTPEDFQEGMGAAQLIAVANKKAARRKAKKA